MSGPILVPLLVLGARVQGGVPGPMLERRLERAFQLWRGQDIIVSGRGEAEVMEAYLIGKGVPAENIIVEPNATSTNENLENSHALYRAPYFDVVTSDFHALRTKLWSWHLGIPVRVHSAFTPWELKPENYLREVLATPHSAARIIWRRICAAVYDQ
ncbi:YdcF family protein [Corynebacterium striatum]|uniref:YdcF family protein n=1 Tax=Corynebacterium striatum TaxID=43770 RepID=UPI001A2561DB|nr:YdcF family protein [Corynebacterium striatum]MDC7105368.1 YdcF family protein [Corynebacterium striatum]HAT1212181.1 YdcF family protein [Corynebacterium striatum]HAT1475489.1 YdcF family protein [Corynebacterium striatum]HAT6524415.1 YdcF family protein [Corynebacterium striatum]HAT6562547.1 YdcF family protein [Corynebacterium striatum]